MGEASVSGKTNVDINKYIPMIAKHARKAWFELPPQTRSWLTFEDFLASGVHHATFHLVKRFDPSRATFSTFLWRSTSAFYRGRVSDLYRQKRFEGRNVPIGDLQIFFRPKFDRDVMLADQFTKLWLCSSPRLKKLLQRHVLYRIPFKGRGKARRFRHLKAETLMLARDLRITVRDFELFLTTKGWLSHFNWRIL